MFIIFYRFRFILILGLSVLLVSLFSVLWFYQVPYQKGGAAGKRSRVDDEPEDAIKTKQ